MAVLFMFIGLSSVIISTFFLIVSIGEKRLRNNWWLVILLYSIFIICLWFPTVQNTTITEKTHHSLLTNEFEDRSFTSVVQVDYDIYGYKWWTYNAAVNTFSKNNFTIIFANGEKETIKRIK